MHANTKSTYQQMSDDNIHSCKTKWLAFIWSKRQYFNLSKATLH